METENSLVHLIYVPFRGVGIDLRNDKWFYERIEIFSRFTLQSLRKQTNQNFIVWLSFREQDESNPLVGVIARRLEEAKIRYVMTFNGLMYYDDKFSDDIQSKIMNILRIVRRCWKIKNWDDFLPSLRAIKLNKNHTLQSRLSKSLAILKHYFQEADWVYVSRIDSDDMFNEDFVETVQGYAPFFGALICGKGLIYNSTTKELAEWNPTTNPPFHTIIFPSESFFDTELHLRCMRDFRSHEDIPKIFGTYTLPDFMYCVTTHDPKNHISTNFTHSFKGDIISNSILNKFI